MTDFLLSIKGIVDPNVSVSEAPDARRAIPDQPTVTSGDIVPPSPALDNFDGLKALEATFKGLVDIIYQSGVISNAHLNAEMKKISDQFSVGAAEQNLGSFRDTSAAQESRTGARGFEAGQKIVVEKGDTLDSIVEKYPYNKEEFLKANPQIKDPNLLQIGQEIIVPAVDRMASTGLVEPINLNQSEVTEIAQPAAVSNLEEGSSLRPKARPETKVGDLIISEGTRASWKPSSGLYNISLDFNSFKGGSGTEVIVPDNSSPEVRAAAERFNQLVVDFAAKHGYENYKNRGVKTRSENKRGVSNTIHVEPFFTQDSKMENIIKANMEEFSSLYTSSFKDLQARMIAPHGVLNKQGVQDRGAVSKTFKDELTFGERIISLIKKKADQ
jgi:LysM repeat protein